MTTEPTTKDKQITVAVPEERVAEFYAFYGRFLAGPQRRRGHGHRCGGHHHRGQPRETTASEPATQTA
jgi:hypothetical protein